MKRRTNEGQPRDISAHLQPLVDDDAFLTALSRGDDPSNGTDPLAGMLLGLRADVNRQVPPAPLVDEESADAVEATTGADDADGQPATPIGDAPSRRRRTSPWAAGLIGAAAATALVVGTGAALYGATPGSPLWGPASALFGDRAAAVQLAGTLDELEAANASGDTDHARHLLDHARELVDTMNPGESRDRQHSEREPGATVTEQATPRASEPKVAPTTVQPGETPASATVTERVTETVTVSVTPEPEPTRARPAEPGPATVTVPPVPAQPVPSAQPTDGGTGEPGQDQAAETTARAGEAPQR